LNPNEKPTVWDVTLKAWDPERDETRRLRLQVLDDNQLIVCGPKHSDGLLALEVHEGRLRLLVWADPEAATPTQKIDLEEAWRS
jgi:hypothetical protein